MATTRPTKSHMTKQESHDLATYHPLPEEISLLCLTEAADSHVREKFFLQDVLGVSDPLLTSDPRLCSTDANEVQSNILLLDYKCLIQRRFQLERGERGGG